MAIHFEKGLWKFFFKKFNSFIDKCSINSEFVEQNLAPDFLKRYLVAKRAVETKLMNAASLRPVIVRPSLIYSMDRPASYVPVGAFFVGNLMGLPFVDKPVRVDTLAAAIVNAIGQEDVQGILRYQQIEELGGTPATKTSS